MNLNIEVDLGRRILGLIGPNGAGKTTLFNCITGEEQPTSGIIQFPKSDIGQYPFQRAHAGVARTFQTPRLFRSMTVAENIGIGALCRKSLPLVGSFLGSKNWRSFSQKRYEVVQSIIDYLGLSAIANEQVDSLPLGVERLIELGRALATCPRIILLDEVASGMNDTEKQFMAQLIDELSKQAGIGFIVVEHDMKFVINLVNELVVLNAGKIIAYDKTHEVINNTEVVKAYLGETNYASY